MGDGMFRIGRRRQWIMAPLGYERVDHEGFVMEGDLIGSEKTLSFRPASPEDIDRLASAYDLVVRKG